MDKIIYCIIAFVAALILIGWLDSKRRVRKVLAATENRDPLNYNTLQGHNWTPEKAEIAASLNAFINSLYNMKICINLEDHVISQLALDPDDVEDFMEQFATKYQIQVHCSKPVNIPSDPTVLQLVDLCYDLLRKGEK